MFSKFKRNYSYSGLGFPVVIDQAEFIKRGKLWILKVDIEKIADNVIIALLTKRSGLSGSEIKFIRTYFNLSRLEFADLVIASEILVKKWESSGLKKADINPAQEVLIRAFVKLILHGDAGFSDFYKGLLGEAGSFKRSFSNKPIKVNA